MWAIWPGAAAAEKLFFWRGRLQQKRKHRSRSARLNWAGPGLPTGAGHGLLPRPWRPLSRLSSLFTSGHLASVPILASRLRKWRSFFPGMNRAPRLPFSASRRVQKRPTPLLLPPAPKQVQRARRPLGRLLRATSFQPRRQCPDFCLCRPILLRRRRDLPDRGRLLRVEPSGQTRFSLSRSPLARRGRNKRCSGVQPAQRQSSLPMPTCVRWAVRGRLRPPASLRSGNQAKSSPATAFKSRSSGR